MKVFIIDDSRFSRVANERALMKAGLHVISVEMEKRAYDGLVNTLPT